MTVRIVGLGAGSGWILVLGMQVCLAFVLEEETVVVAVVVAAVDLGDKQLRKPDHQSRLRSSNGTPGVSSPVVCLPLPKCPRGCRPDRCTASGPLPGHSPGRADADRSGSFDVGTARMNGRGGDDDDVWWAGCYLAASWRDARH